MKQAYETAAAVVRDNENGCNKILSNVVSSQTKEHEKFGGVVPKFNKRSHLENIEFIIDKPEDSKISESNI